PGRGGAARRTRGEADGAVGRGLEARSGGARAGPVLRPFLEGTHAEGCPRRAGFAGRGGALARRSDAEPAAGRAPRPRGGLARGGWARGTRRGRASPRPRGTGTGPAAPDRGGGARRGNVRVPGAHHPPLARERAAAPAGAGIPPRLRTHADGGGARGTPERDG